MASRQEQCRDRRTLVITRRAVEHHIASIFAKLHLPSEQEVSRRVQATLLYLSERRPA